MVDKWDVSADKLTWTFTLARRPGVERRHSRSPRRTASPRSSAGAPRDSMGQKMLASVAGFEAVDAKTFKMKMKEPYGLVLESLGKPSSNVPFMMPKKTAETDPVHADQGRGRDRLRPVRVRRQRVEARREGRVRQEPDLQAARRAALGPGRRQDRQGRPHRMDLDPRRADPGRGAAERRDRHARSSRRSTCCRSWPRTRTSSCSTAIRWATSTRCASTRCSSRSTIPRSATRRWSRSARRTSSRPRSAIPSTTRSARRCSSAARRSPATRAWPTC